MKSPNHPSEKWSRSCICKKIFSHQLPHDKYDCGITPPLVSTELFLVQLLCFNKGIFLCLLLRLCFCCHHCHACLSAIILKGYQGGEITHIHLSAAQVLSTASNLSLTQAAHQGKHIKSPQSWDQQQVVFPRKLKKNSGRKC